MEGAGHRRAFMLFHLVLGLGLVIASTETLLHALGHVVNHGNYGYIHLIFVAGLETVGALLFLFPATLRVGGVLLLITLLGVWVVQLARGEWRVDLLIYAAGVWFVMAHGAAWGSRPSASSATT
jgi:hypothetical protein